MYRQALNMFAACAAAVAAFSAFGGKTVPRPVPRPALLERMVNGPDIIGIVHWGLNTYTDREWGYGDVDPKLLNPVSFDADQIVGAAKAGGIGGLVIVAKHHDGFCLWPTKTTDYNITKTPFWEQGKGNGERGRNYVKEMEQACRRVGLKFGVYVSPWDRHDADYAGEKYVEKYHAQIKELLGGDYGEVFEMWFDGANGGDGWYGGAKEKRTIGKDYYRLGEVMRFVRELQPGVTIFGGGSGRDFRWPQNERGILDPDSRATCPDIGRMDRKAARLVGNRGSSDGEFFHVCEADFPLRKGWFWHERENGTTKSAAYLTKLYLSSVGNGGTMNIGLAPNKDGVLDDADVQALAGFGAMRRALFAHEAIEVGEPFNVVVMSEDISKGERVDEWEFVADGTAILRGKSIGAKRIRLLETPCAAKTRAVKVLKGADGDVAVSFRLYFADPELVRAILDATAESGETDTAKWMTASDKEELCPVSEKVRGHENAEKTAKAKELNDTALAGRVETRLDGNAWTLDNLPVLVPNCWNKRDAADGKPWAKRDGKFAQSVDLSSYARRCGTYRRDLPDAKPGRRYFIRCDGASQKAAMRVNGVAIGSHKGAFTAFCFEATAALKPSGNKLEIEVSNEFDPDIPPIDGDFNICGGLYRSVWLIETDPVCIDPTLDGGPGVRVFPAMDGTVRVEVDVSGADDAAVDWEPKKIESPRFWSPEEPNLYAVTVTVSKAEWRDSIVQPFGFRTAEMREDGFYLNGVRRKVRGVNRHQDFEGAGWEMTPQQEELDFRLIKAMGADGVRLAHYPQSENVFDLCDRLGLMVWTETPVVNRIGGAAFRENARTVMREMVAQKRNHPCVCWWGCWNELYNGVPRNARPVPGDWEAEMRSLSELCASLDPSRPVVAASCKPADTNMNASVPFICRNTYPGWYGKYTMRHAVDSFLKANASVGVMGISEYGAGASVFHHENPVQRPETTAVFHPEEWQTRVHMESYRDILKHERVWGSFVWAMFDFAADGRREGDRDGINDKGLVTRDRTTPKDAYFFYKANWNAEPMLHLCGKRLVETTNAAVQVVAFCNTGDVTLSVNGKTVGVRSPDEIRSVTFDNVPLAPGVNTIRVEAGGLSDECRWRLVPQVQSK